VSVQSESSSRSADAATALLAVAVGLGLLAASWGVLHMTPFDGFEIVDTPVYQDYGEAIAGGQVPYRDFALEYPPGALPIFWLPTLASGEHYRSAFEILMWICAAATLVAVGRALAALETPPRRALLTLAFVGVFPVLLGTVVLTRYDLWPTALTAASLAALVSSRERLGFGFLAVAVSAKIFPLVLLPPAFAHVVRRRGPREAVVCLGVLLGVLALFVVPFALLAPDGLLDSLQRQLDRPLQIESLGAAFLLAAHQIGLYDPSVVSTHGSQNLAGSLPDRLALAETVLQGLALLAIWTLAVRGPASPARLVTAAAASVASVVALAKVLSPQFLIWLVPLVPLVAGSPGLLAGTLLGISLVTTQLWFPSRYWDVVDLGPEGWLVLLRDLALVALAGVLALATQRRERAGPRSA
jgi:Glycosyltransferase family 87